MQEDLQDLIKSVMSPNPDDRATLEAVRHPPPLAGLESALARGRLWSARRVRGAGAGEGGSLMSVGVGGGGRRGSLLCICGENGVCVCVCVWRGKRGGGLSLWLLQQPQDEL